MAAQLIVIIIMISLNCGFFDHSVHDFDLTVRPRMIDFRKLMFDTIFIAPLSEHMG